MNLFLVQSYDGKYLRSIGYGGGGNCWVDKKEKAKIYTTLGKAMARVTYWVNNYPEYPAPHIVVLKIADEAIIEVDVQAIRIKKLKKELSKTKSWLKYAQESGNGDIVRYSMEVMKLKAKIKEANQNAIVRNNKH